MAAATNNERMIIGVPLAGRAGTRTHGLIALAGAMDAVSRRGQLDSSAR